MVGLLRWSLLSIKRITSDNYLLKFCLMIFNASNYLVVVYNSLTGISVPHSNNTNPNEYMQHLYISPISLILILFSFY